MSDKESEALSLESSSSSCTARKKAIEMQQDFYEMFGYENEIIWDCYERDDEVALIRKVKLIISNEDDNPKVNALIDKIIEAIWKQRKYSGGALLMAPIFVLSVKYETYKDNIKNAINSTQFVLHPVFRIRKCVKNEDSHNCCMIFVDEHARVYANWNEYLNNNTLPKAIIITPKRGIYSAGILGHVLLDIYPTPECSPGVAVIKAADIGTTVASLGSSAILIAGVCSAPIAAPVLAGAAIVGISCGAYSLLRGSFSLFERHRHEQAIHLADAEARGNWLGIAGGVFGLAAGGAVRGVAYMARNGQNVGVALRATVNILNGAAIATNGVGVVNGFFGIYIRYKEDEKISALDIVQLSASLFMFTHSIYNFQTANRIIQTNQEATIRTFREDLSRNQKRMFDKMSKETVRLKGGDTGRSDIIRSLKNIPDRPEYFRDIYKINKELNKNNIKISFGADGKAVMNNAEPFKPAEMRQQLKQNAPAGVFANIPENPEGNLVNVNSELNLAIPKEIDIHSFLKMISGIQDTFRVLNKDDLRSSLINLLENLTVDAFNTLIDYVKHFVRHFGDEIQRELHRIISFEVYLNDIFKILVQFAQDSIQENTSFKNNTLSSSLSSYIENELDKYAPIIETAIRDFYNQFRPSETLSGTCKLCGGMFYVGADV